MAVTDMTGSELLPGRPIRDLVDVDLRRLAHRKCDARQRLDTLSSVFAFLLQATLPSAG
jgi:hypothetical protein